MNYKMGGGTLTVLYLFLAVVTIAVDVSLVALGSKALVVVAIVSRQLVLMLVLGYPAGLYYPGAKGNELGIVVWLFSYVRRKVRLAKIT